RRLRERIRSPAAGRGKRYAVDRRQRAVDKSVVRGEEVAIIPPLANQQIDDRLESLFLGAIGHSLVELGVDRRILDQVLKPIELQHVREEGANAVLKQGGGSKPGQLLL